MKITTAEYIKSATRFEHFPEQELPEFLFCGRSNVGKSSFINALCSKKNLARTSSKPGKTQTLNIFNINNICYFVDVPGYGYAAVSKQKRAEFGEMIELYVSQRAHLVKTFLLVDFRHEPSDDDVLMYNFLKYYNRDVVVVATKMDKVKRSQHGSQKKLITKKLNLADTDKLIVTSSEKRIGFDTVLEVIENSLK